MPRARSMSPVDDAGLAERRVERLPGWAKWVWVGGGPQTGVDADEQQPQARADQVGDGRVPERLELGPGETHRLTLAGGSGAAARPPGTPRPASRGEVRVDLVRTVQPEGVQHIARRERLHGAGIARCRPRAAEHQVAVQPATARHRRPRSSSGPAARSGTSPAARSPDRATYRRQDGVERWPAPPVPTRRSGPRAGPAARRCGSAAGWRTPGRTAGRSTTAHRARSSGQASGSHGVVGSLR